MYAYLHTCIPAYLHILILVFLHTNRNPHAYINANLNTCIPAYCILGYLHYLYTWILYILAYLHICIFAYFHVHQAYLNAYILAYLHTCIPAYMHTCIIAYLYTISHQLCYEIAFFQVSILWWPDLLTYLRTAAIHRGVFAPKNINVCKKQGSMKIGQLMAYISPAVSNLHK